jgi:hypothetical protein
MKRLLIPVLLSLLVGGCVSKPAARVETVASVAPDAPLAVGDAFISNAQMGASDPSRGGGR